MSVLVETSLGDIVIDLHFKIAPVACKNFLKLCKLKKYNNCEFFKVEKDFIAQTGDPNNDGTGGTSVYEFAYGKQAAFFEDEFSPQLRHIQKGVVSMANAGPDQNASQFFITLGENLRYLDDKHTIFGYVAEGQEVLDSLNQVFVNLKHRPYQIIRIHHTIILHDPFDDPPGLEFPEYSPLPESDDDASRLGEDEEIAAEIDEGRAQEMEEARKKKEAQSRAEVLEMIGDIEDADLKPPENVLFVCRLNPVTRDEDIELIFSRFGECTANIIKDQKTQDSLCYGFIEFEDEKACVQAYFKMNNCLIDDRRIKVDFSQSVSRLWNDVRRGKYVRLSEEYENDKNSGYEQASTSGMLFDEDKLKRMAFKRKGEDRQKSGKYRSPHRDKRSREQEDTGRKRRYEESREGERYGEEDQKKSASRSESKDKVDQRSEYRQERSRGSGQYRGDERDHQDHYYHRYDRRDRYYRSSSRHND